jgi:hypothetical protein
MKNRTLTVLYFIPIVALPIAMVGFVALVFATKPPRPDVSLPTQEAADTRKPAAAAVSGASLPVRPDGKATGASDSSVSLDQEWDGSGDLYIGSGVVLRPVQRDR